MKYHSLSPANKVYIVEVIKDPDYDYSEIRNHLASNINSTKAAVILETAALAKLANNQGQNALLNRMVALVPITQAGTLLAIPFLSPQKNLYFFF